MFFVPIRALRDMEGFKRENHRDYHVEAMVTAARHTIKWAKYILSKYYLKGLKALPVRSIIAFFIRYAEKRIEEEYRKNNHPCRRASRLTASNSAWGSLDTR